MTRDPNQVDELQDDQVELSSAQSAPEEAAAESDEPSTDVGQLQQELERVKNELAQAQEQSLRAQAELHNVRRRAQQDVEKAHKFGLEKFVGDILPVADNLERALNATQEQAGDFQVLTEGVELTLKSLLDALKRHQVEQVNPAGEPFNPEYHQAMTAVPNPDVEPNTVLDVFQNGYTLHGRLVRPAMVVVSKAPEQA